MSEAFFTHASSVVTVVSFLTFLGILWWAFSSRRTTAFSEAANLPFADDNDEINANKTEGTHG